MSRNHRLGEFQCYWYRGLIGCGGLICELLMNSIEIYVMPQTFPWQSELAKNSKKDAYITFIPLKQIPKSQ